MIGDAVKWDRDVINGAESSYYQNLNINVKRMTKQGAHLTDIRDVLATEYEGRGSRVPSSRPNTMRLLIVYWASNDCYTRKGSKDTSEAEKALTDIFKLASYICDAATFLGPGDAQTWGLSARWQYASVNILQKLHEFPVTQYPGDQLWPIYRSVR